MLEYFTKLKNLEKRQKKLSLQKESLQRELNKIVYSDTIGFYEAGIFLFEKEDRHLWSPPYYVESIGVSNQQAVANYIDDQRKKEASHDKD